MDEKKATKETLINQIENMTKQLVVAHAMLEDLSVFASGMRLFIQEKGLVDELEPYLDEFYKEVRKKDSKVGKVNIHFETFDKEEDRNA